MNNKEIIEKLKKIHQLPVNYRFVVDLSSEDKMKNSDVNVVKFIEVTAYKTEFATISRHHKPLSKIVDYSVFAENKT